MFKLSILLIIIIIYIQYCKTIYLQYLVICAIFIELEFYKLFSSEDLFKLSDSLYKSVSNLFQM